MQRLAGNQAVGRLAQRDPAALAAVAVQRAPEARRDDEGGVPPTAGCSSAGAWAPSGPPRCAEQAAELIRVGTVPRASAPADVERMLTAAGWASWSPAADHGLWDDLVKAFDDVGGAFGGVPKIDRILFFQTAYKYDTSKRGGPAWSPHTEGGRVRQRLDDGRQRARIQGLS